MPSAGFAQKWASDEIFIEKNNRRAIYEILRSDNHDEARYRQRRGRPQRIGRFELLSGIDCEVNEEYLLCLSLANADLFGADVIYYHWDIKDVFEKQAYKLSIEYIELDLPKE